MPTIDTDDGTTLYYEWAGKEDGPVLVLSNSLGASLGMWDDQVAAFGERFHLLRYDDRGHGKSAAPEGPYSLDRLGKDVVALLDALGLDKVSWCGLSKGGMLGMWLGSKHPERIDKLVLADTAAYMPPPELWNERAATARDKGLQAMAPAILERWFTAAFREASPEAVEKVREMIVATPGEGYAATCEALRDMDQRTAIRSIEAPTLVVVGADDPATPPDQARAIHQAIPGARLAILDNAAHLSNIEQANIFNEVVLGFLGG
ncbi:3-oxoadipate enol-lactonase [Rhodobium orientis]|uniref:3-oxoadipate enol-lactonase n=1 Tax=Rhodobium orientis TaxID=34017 RepID=A0A327JTK7_9HYPH|nr:3-oxoadipate enol-lactonase [Rhodobium orientis]MBB4301745.1 3-oxoadipate enol-lactonase [Rhodobium orientis]MBK5950548.1 3-oxoadipate enol-lactonase [Rhodobium orientis]RAI28242.1 3-oxoadipate enol-lactonase [Rhodobium orientis]